MDLGAAVHEHAGLTTFVVNYGGLGQRRGSFGFLKSVEESVAFVEQLRAGYQFAKISVYGASWGGLVALNAASRLGTTLGSLILASPFSLLPSQDHARSMLLELSKEEAYPRRLLIENALADMKKRRISHPTIPGEMLAEEFLIPNGLSQTALAEQLDVHLAQ